MKENKDQQLFFTRWAIQLGEKGRCTSAPNPWVGCVIVKDGEILGEGYHEAAGKKHAEIMAIEKAGLLAKGATAYVSLEPCPHHGRTPPCANAIIEAGIKKVVIPILDPDPRVCGKGIETLKKAGIEVVLGIGKEEAENSLAPYLFQRVTKRPFCVLKSAISLDGRTAASDGSSQWITGEKARLDVQLLRAQSQAILIGARTALMDLPRLTVRTEVTLRQPLRVLFDPKGNVSAEGPLADINLAPTLVFTCSSKHEKDWKQSGAEIVIQEQLDLKKVLEELGKREIIQLLVEGGSHIHSLFLKQNLANRIVIYIGNCFLGHEGKPFIPDFFIPNITKAPRLLLQNLYRLENDVRLDYCPEIINRL